MKKLQIRYVACVLPITGIMEEECNSDAGTMRELLEELEVRYGGFCDLFINRESGRLNLNTMIYYGEDGKAPVAVIDLEQPIKDGASVMFW
jgi:hypothetical protein